MKARLLLLAAGLLALPFARAATPSYTAHEWGTFTSVQGADGVQMNWNPLTVAELPRFVYDRTRTKNIALRFAKTALYAKQRLETPVIYFHAAAPFSVDVSVSFPDGNVTEWFPAATVRNPTRADSRAIEWNGVRVIPHAPANIALPAEASGSHYYAAREAEADFVQVTAGEKTESEKLLFYRGTGNFDAPLIVMLPSADEGRLKLINNGLGAARAISDLFVVRVHDGTMAITDVEGIVAQSSVTALVGTPRPLAEARLDLAAKLRAALARAGLTDSEAAAMVKTWDDSWFAENGLRVLYVLPRAWADEVLPLSLTPAPREVVRVFVGRAEIITPTMERTLAAEVERFGSDRRTAVANVRALGLERFLEPALRRLSQQRPDDRALSTDGWELLQAANRAPAAVAYDRR